MESIERQKADGKVFVLKSALEVVTMDLASLTTNERVERIAEIGKIVAGFVPFGYTSALLAGMCDKERETGSDHVAEALEKAMAEIEDAESSTLD